MSLNKIIVTIHIWILPLFINESIYNEVKELEKNRANKAVLNNPKATSAQKAAAKKALDKVKAKEAAAKSRKLKKVKAEMLAALPPKLRKEAEKELKNLGHEGV